MQQLVRATASPTQIGEWDLVLAAAGIERQIVEQDGQFVLLVGAEDEAAATAALAAFDAEAPAAPEPPAPDVGRSPLGLLCAIGFAALFVASGTRDGGSVWFQAGSASAELIARGAWWRAVTALTLHADLLHLAGNVVASLLFISAVGRWLGAGLGALLILGAATVANLLTAAVHRTAHVSVGASTATFAALGVVAGLQAVRRWRHAPQRRYAWLPLGAGLGLFAMLGVGPGTDVYAHLFGLGVGAAVGVAGALGNLQAPRRGWQALLGAAALAAVLGAWAFALRAVR